MSEETLRASLMSTGPLIAWPALWRTWLASIRSEPVSLKIVFGAFRWFCSAAVAVMGLKDDPVGYRPWIARFASGASVCREVSAWYWLWVIGWVKIEGSKVGDEPIASTSPFWAFIATNAPGRPKVSSAPSP